jgi:hypothetical protein
MLQGEAGKESSTRVDLRFPRSVDPAKSFGEDGIPGQDRNRINAPHTLGASAHLIQDLAQQAGSGRIRLL